MRCFDNRSYITVYGFSRARPLIPVLTVSSAITHLSPSMDCLKPDRSLCTVSNATARLLLAMDCLEPDCSFPSPLCCFERLSSWRLQIVLSLTARSPWLLVPVLAVLSATACLAVYGLSRDRPMIVPIPTVLSATTRLSPSTDCLEPGHLFLSPPFRAQPLV
ncbi:hypothetical protein L210DRAFT_986896 [Boletus edulis BED1]|uniref:Uncharacterized protein n=1 Tax=Boletus edulis BED1 TaxID=1328754 RepID=A0AAD4G894_BOLED|nr:hypothetical protein L210DRAFT_986896 [Boletus edulis BED1]